MYLWSSSATTSRSTSPGRGARKAARPERFGSPPVPGGRVRAPELPMGRRGVQRDPGLGTVEAVGLGTPGMKHEARLGPMEREEGLVNPPPALPADGLQGEASRERRPGSLD